MLLVIHNLPLNTKYADVKTLIQSKCGLKDVILDNLANEGSFKRVTVGLADEGDGAILVRKINGLYIDGQQLYVEDVRKNKDSEQPYRASKNLPALQDNYAHVPMQDVAPLHQNQDNNMMFNNMVPMSNMYSEYAMPFMQVMPLAQNTYMGFGGGQQQSVMSMMPMTDRLLDRPLRFDGENTGRNAVEWITNDVTQPDRSRLPYEDRRAESPPRERLDAPMNRNQSRWDESGGPRGNRRRSPSPQRGWKSRDRLDNFQNRSENYLENPPEMAHDDVPQNYVRAPHNMNSASNFRGPRNNNRPDSFGGPRNKNPPNQNFGGPRNKNPDFEGPRSMNAPVPNFGGPRNNPSNANFGGPRNNSSNSNFGGPRNNSSNSNIGGPRNKNPNFEGPRNMNAPAPNFGGPRKNPSNSNFGAPREVDFSSSNYRDSEQFIEEPSSNMFGRRNMERKSSRWEQQDNQNRFESELFQSQRPQRPPGRDAPKQNMKEVYEPRGPIRGEPRPSRSFERQREEPKAPVKRDSSRWQEEPQAKRFAPMGPGIQRPSIGNARPKPPYAPNAPNARERQLEPSQFLNSDNTEMTVEKLLNKDETWRGQATSCIAKAMVDSLGIKRPLAPSLFHHLKSSIRARINVMLGDKIMERLQIMEMYASKFPSHGDKRFYKSVVNHFKEKESLQASQASHTDTTTGSDSAKAFKPGKPLGALALTKFDKQGYAGPKAKPSQPAKKTPSKPPPKVFPSGRLLPNFPEGDKISYKKTKAEEKKGWHEEKHELPEDLKKALGVEVDTMCDIFMNECMNPDNEIEKPVCEQIADVVSDDFMKVIRVQVSKRLLNDAKNLVVRVHCGRGITAALRKALEKFLIGYNCIALQKSDRQPQLLMAHFDSYDNMDKVVQLGSVEIDGVTFSFKALHVCGPPPSAKVLALQHKEKIKKLRQSQMIDTDENILQPGYVYKPGANKAGNTTKEYMQKVALKEEDLTKFDNEVEFVEDQTNLDDEVEFVEDQTNDEVEFVEDQTNLDDEVEFLENQTDLDVEVGLEEDDDAADNAGDDENPDEDEIFPVEEDDVEDENIDEDDLEDY